jgi:hypothetical protein
MEPIRGEVLTTEINPIDAEMLHYQRQTRTAAVVLAWAVCIFSIAVIVCSIVGLVLLAKYGNSIQVCDRTIQVCP